MRRIRIEQRPRRARDGDRAPVLPLDPRDPDVLRAKRVTRSALRDRDRV